MKTFSTSILALCMAVVGATAISSCSDYAPYAGQWQGNSERIAVVPGAADANVTITIDFAPDLQKQGTGDVLISAVTEVRQAVMPADVAADMPYAANITATASISGKYVTEDGDADDDDLLVSFDPQSMNVFVDRSGVVFTQNIVSDMQQPAIDSLTEATATRWQTILTPVLHDIFNRYTKIEDIKVHHNDMKSLEVAHRDYTFRRVGVPE